MIDPVTGQEIDPSTGLPIDQGGVNPVQQATPTEINPQVKEYLAKKFNLGQFSNENRQKLADTPAVGLQDKFGAALAALGAGFSGQNAGAAGQAKLSAAKQAHADKLSTFDTSRSNMIQENDLAQKAKSQEELDAQKAREDDPNSQESQIATQAAKEMGYDKPVTATQFKSFSPAMEKIYQIKSAALARKDALNAAAAAKLEAARTKKEEEGTAGQKQVDKDYAKDYNAWTSGDGKTARVEIDKIDNVIKDIEDGKVSLGRENRLVPESLTSSDRIKARHDIESSVMSSLRATLGAQFTEAEGKRVISNTWDENDTENNNIDRLRRLSTTIKNKADDNDKKAKLYEGQGTLKNLKTVNEPATGNPAAPKPSWAK